MKRNIKMKNTTIGTSSDDSGDIGDVTAGASTYNEVSSSATPGVSNAQIGGGGAGLRISFRRDDNHHVDDDDTDTSLHQCETCRATFKSKKLYDKHRLFCATLAAMRSSGPQHHQNSSVSAAASAPAFIGGRDSGRTNKKYTIMSVDDDALLPSPKEMFMLIQELTLKYNKVKEELDVMKTWAKMVGRRLGGGGGGGGGGEGITAGSAASAGNSDYLIPFTSISRQKRQNMEMILNDDDAAMSAAAASTGQQCPIQQRPCFTRWYSSFTLEQEHLDYVFQTDLVSGIVNVILKLVSAYTNESGKSHLIPFKFTDVKQGSFYIYDAPFSLDVPVLPPPGSETDVEKRWRFIEPCEFQLMVNSVHKLLLKEFKKWQDRNWEQQNKIIQNRQKATLSYRSVISSFQCSPAMASCDDEYHSTTATGAAGGAGCAGGGDGDEPNTPPPHLKDAILTDDFASLYNKYADKVMGGVLSPDTIITRVRAKLWKDMKAWML